MLLGRKKRGFGVGKLNGFGGKVEPGETLLAAALREMAEESGVTVDAADAAATGHLTFTFADSPSILSVHIFTAGNHRGEPRETDEMAPAWFPADAMPVGEMWADDRFWLPLALSGQRFVGCFAFRGTEEILSHSLDVVESLPFSPQSVLVTGARQADIAI